MGSFETNIHCLNSMLRGELSAIDTYQQARHKVGKADIGSQLHAIEADHREIAALLRQYISERGGEPSDSAGVWGSWAKIVEGSAQLFGQAAALKALQEGERHGIRVYEDVVKNSTIDKEFKDVIEANLLPRARRHVPILDQLIHAA